MSLYLAKPEHEVAYQDICKLVSKHSATLTPLDILAVAANMVGKLVALQDQRKITVAMAMEIVAKNLEHGNQTIVNKLANGPDVGQA